MSTGIRFLRSKNFQGYKDCEIEFVPGTNYIWGDTDSGKSTILRKIEWCLQNTPAGFHFARKGIKSTTCVEVEIEFFDGTKILRRRNKNTINEYVLNDDFENPYKALKGAVPERIKEAINLSGLSLQGQAEQFFLVDLPDKQRAKKINEVVDLEIIDLFSKKVKKTVTEVKKEIELNEVRVNQNNKKIEELYWIEEAQKELDDLFALDEEILKRKKAVASLEAFSEDLEELNAQSEVLHTLLDKKERADELLCLKKEVKQKEESFQTLHSMKERLQYMKERMAEVNKTLKYKEQIKDLKNFLEEIKKSKEDFRFLDSLRKKIDNATVELQEISKKKSHLEKRKRELLNTLEVCPFCGEVCTHE
jgi:DNA repair exonuclease SbcCD ATPase subunit